LVVKERKKERGKLTESRKRQPLIKQKQKESKKKDKKTYLKDLLK
jgi:hypothetical protein